MAQQGKLDILATTWLIRGWDVVILTDIKLSRPNDTTVMAEVLHVRDQTWTILHRGRVGIALKTSLYETWAATKTAAWVDKNASDNRLLSITIPVGSTRMQIIAAYFPTSNGENDAERTRLNARIITKVDSKPKNCLTVIAGDFNASPNPIDNSGHTGPHCPTTSSRTSSSLSELCEACGVEIASTYFKQSVEGTWAHPRDGTKHLIDHILLQRPLQRRTRRCIILNEFAHTNGPQRLRPWRALTDHDPVEAVIALTHAPHKEKESRKINTSKLSLQGPDGDKARANFAQHLIDAMRSKYMLPSEAQEVPSTLDRWRDFTNLCKEATTVACGFQQRKAALPWLDGRQDEIDNLNKTITTARSARNAATTRQASLKHANQLKRAMTRKTKCYRRWESSWWEELAAEAQNAARQNDTKTLYILTKKLTTRADMRKPTAKRQVACTAEDLAAWREHFLSIQSVQTPIQNNVWLEVPERSVARSLANQVTRKEFDAAVQAIKEGRAAGLDGLEPEMIKRAPPEVKDWLFSAAKEAWRAATSAQDGAEADTWPTEWRTACIIPLHKKGERSDKNNYRGICLLSLGVKIIARIVSARLQEWSEQIIDESQCGGRRGRGTDDALSISRGIVEATRHLEGQVSLTFLDVKKAYPSISRAALWQLLARLGLPLEFIKVCRALHNGTEYHVRMAGSLSEAYSTQRGLKEGCPSSTSLFLVYHWAVMMTYRNLRKKMEKQGRPPLGIDWVTKVTVADSDIRSARDTVTTNISDILFADDTTLVEETIAIPAAEKDMNSALGAWGVELNEGKTERITVGAAKATSAKHVGGRLRSDARHCDDLAYRIARARSTIGSLKTAWRFRMGRKDATHPVKRETRAKIMRSFVEPIVLWSCKTRTWTKVELRKVDAIQAAAARTVLGLTMYDKESEHQKNRDICAKLGWTPLSNIVQFQVWKWFGHLARMPMTRLPKLVTFGNPVLTGSKRKSRIRLRHTFRSLLAQTGISRASWFTLAQDRSAWVTIGEKAFNKNKRTALDECVAPATKRQRSATLALVCPLCDERLPSQTTYEKHLHVSHPAADHKVTNQQTQHCFRCLAPFNRMWRLKAHKCPSPTCLSTVRKQQATEWGPIQHGPHIHYNTQWLLYTDGSGGVATPRTAGWGVAIFSAGAYQWEPDFSLYGPVVICAEDEAFLGATKHSNNTAELSAICEALLWLRDEAPGDSALDACILYDSEYAADSIVGINHGVENFDLVDYGRKLYDEVRQQRQISWQHVYGHAKAGYIHGNFWADALANKGAKGEVSTQSIRWAKPEEDHPKAALATETCRKCGKLFLNARSVVAHERGCQAGPADNPNVLRCRLCLTKFSGAQPRKARNRHEQKCRGDKLSNVMCFRCRRSFSSLYALTLHEPWCD